MSGTKNPLLRLMQTHLVLSMEKMCSLVDRLPDWTFPVVGIWLGCPAGLARWAFELEERWELKGIWPQDKFPELYCDRCCALLTSEFHLEYIHNAREEHDDSRGIREKG